MTDLFGTRAARPLALPRRLTSVLAPTALLLVTAGLSGAVQGQSCPEGFAPRLQVGQSCSPSDCSSLQAMDWGSGGVPDQVVSIDKFDPSLGTLLEVDLVCKFQHVRSGCVDNTASSCTAAQLTVAFITTATASASNTPPVTAIPHAQIVDFVDLTPVGFQLGAADGFDDCANPGAGQGAPSSGDCTPGEDHVDYQFDQTYEWPYSRLSGLDVLPWIGGPGTQVSFDTSAWGIISGNIGPGLTSSSVSEGRIWFEVSYTYCPGPLGTTYCDCGSGSPCSNPGGAGEGCANSTGSGSTLSAWGSTSIAASDLVLRGEQLPALQPGLFFQGDAALGGGAGVIFGDGLRCAGGAVLRLQVSRADAAGLVATTIDLGAAGGVASGEVRRYQLWYRDPLGSPCGSGFNLSNGLELVWAP